MIFFGRKSHDFGAKKKKSKLVNFCWIPLPPKKANFAQSRGGFFGAKSDGFGQKSATSPFFLGRKKGFWVQWRRWKWGFFGREVSGFGGKKGDFGLK